MTVTPALDRDRLLRDLRAAALESGGRPPAPRGYEDGRLDGLWIGFRVVAAAIEDGEYDQEEVRR